VPLTVAGIDEGAFTLDPAVALAKLRSHQLSDPHAYVLLLVEAAYLAAADPRATQVRIGLGPRPSSSFRSRAGFPRGRCASCSGRCLVISAGSKASRCVALGFCSCSGSRPTTRSRSRPRSW
jgi:hypothetical protein